MTRHLWFCSEYDKVIICSFRNYESLVKKYPHRKFDPSVYMDDDFVHIPQKKYDKIFTISIRKIL